MMNQKKTYPICIEETRSMLVFISAENVQQAQQFAADGFQRGEYVFADERENGVIIRPAYASESEHRKFAALYASR